MRCHRIFAMLSHRRPVTTADRVTRFRAALPDAARNDRGPSLGVRTARRETRLVFGAVEGSLVRQPLALAIPVRALGREREDHCANSRDRKAVRCVDPGAVAGVRVKLRAPPITSSATIFCTAAAKPAPDVRQMATNAAPTAAAEERRKAALHPNESTVPCQRSLRRGARCCIADCSHDAPWYACPTLEVSRTKPLFDGDQKRVVQPAKALKRDPYVVARLQPEDRSRRVVLDGRYRYELAAVLQDR